MFMGKISHLIFDELLLNLIQTCHRKKCKIFCGFSTFRIHVAPLLGKKNELKAYITMKNKDHEHDKCCLLNINILALHCEHVCIVKEQCWPLVWLVFTFPRFPLFV